MGNFSSDISFFIGIISFLVAIIFFLFTFIARPLNKLQEKISRLEKGSGGKLESPALLSSNFFLTALEKERKFWSKITEERDNKTLIALTIANKYIERNDTILMDSGTTVDQIPLFLVEKGYNSTIYTNNLLAAILVIPYGEEIDCNLLSGEIDPIFGATYSDETTTQILPSLNATLIILAATRISFKSGPMVHSKDYRNLTFKKELVRKSLMDGHKPRLIIATGYSKFTGDLNKEEEAQYNPVLDPETWNSVKAKDRFVLVTTKPPSGMKSRTASDTAMHEIKKFQTNMKKGGMKIEICDKNRMMELTCRT